MRQHQEPPIDGLAVILCASENLYPAQRALLESVFSCRVHSFYGHGEAACLAGNTEASNQYHVCSEYGYTELLAEDGEVLPLAPGTRGEIVATGFNNDAMPFIRYATGDIGIAGADEAGSQRHYPVLRAIEGRKQE